MVLPTLTIVTTPADGGSIPVTGTFGIEATGGPNPNTEGYIKQILISVYVNGQLNTIPVCQSNGGGLLQISAGRWLDAGGSSTAYTDFLLRLKQDPTYTNQGTNDHAYKLGDTVKMHADITQQRNIPGDLIVPVEWTFTIAPPPPPTVYPGEIADHCAQAIKRLAAQYAGKPKITALICAIADEIQFAEHATAQANAALDVDDISSCVGLQLDHIGSRVGEARNGLGDTEYRIRIHARILVNASNGEPEQLIAILAALTAAGTQHLVTSPPGAVIMTTVPVLDAPHGYAFAQMLETAAPAATRVILHHTPAGTLFGWSDDGGAGPWGEFTADPSGGTWAEGADGLQNQV